MPYVSTPSSIEARLTDAGRNAFSRMSLGEISFVLKGFDVGREGYNDANPVLIDPIVTSNTALGDKIFPTTGQKDVETFENPTPKTLVANFRLASNEAVAGLGELGVWAEIINSTVSPSEVGTRFLMAISHFPIMTKTLRQAILYRVIIQF